jgi:DNA transformation protein and related proteins
MQNSARGIEPAACLVVYDGHDAPSAWLGYQRMAPHHVCIGHLRAILVKKKPSAAPRPNRGRLTSLRVSPGFREFVLDQLSEIPDLRAQSMFGGIGLYSGDLFFGIIAADVLYFKVGDANRIAYQEAGARAFKPFVDRPMSMSYYSVPALILEDATVLRTWVASSLDAARNARTATGVRKRRPRR